MGRRRPQPPLLILLVKVLAPLVTVLLLALELVDLLMDLLLMEP